MAVCEFDNESGGNKTGLYCTGIKDQMVNLLLIVPRYNANQLCHMSMILQVFVIFTSN
jgi:hypothetical protein